MLDSNKENLKLDAMKRIVGMIAKGKNASDLFPAVVKNVVSKNVEVSFIYFNLHTLFMQSTKVYFTNIHR